MSLKFRNSRKTSKKGVLDALIWCHLYLAFTGVEVPKKQSFKVLALNFLLIKKEREGRKKKRGWGWTLKPNSKVVNKRKYN